MTDEERKKRKREAQARYKAKHPDRVKATQAKWREANPVAARAATAAWVERNSDRVKETARAYREANREKISDDHKAWSQANRTKVSQRVVQWQKNNPEKVADRGRRRRARLAGAAQVDFTESEWRDLLTQYQHQCAYCGAVGVPLEREHVIPLARGGSHTKGNIVPACGPCNRRKGTKTADEFLRGNP